MPTSININPTDEELDAILEIYTECEQNYPSRPKVKSNFTDKFRYITVVLSMLPALVLVILRIPFILLRKIKMPFLRMKEKQQFKAGIEFYSDEPRYKLNHLQKKRLQIIEEAKIKVAELKKEWLTNPTEILKLVAYAVSESNVNYPRGSRLALYILHQLKEKNNEIEEKKGMLEGSLCLVTDRLSLPNTSYHFQLIAIEKGYAKIQVNKFSFSSLLSFILIREAWDYLLRDIINCWPR